MPSTFGAFPITYYWEFGDGNSATSSNPTHTYSSDGFYQVRMISIDSTGCTDTTVQRIYIYSKLQGWVYTSDSNQVVNNATAYLIQADSTPGGLALGLIDSVDVTQNYYEFTDVAVGEYLVKVALKPASPFYASNLPTYHSSYLTWDSASSILQNGSWTNANILLKNGTNPGGPGFIGGLVSQGANKVAGPVLAGIQVNLLLKDGTPVAYTYTDANGTYEFDNLAYGTYVVHVEILGLPAEDREVILNVSNPSSNLNDFEVGIDMVSIATLSEALILAGPITVFPNPVANMLHIEAELIELSDVKLSVINLLGKRLFEASYGHQVGMQSFDIPTAQFQAGIYLLQMKMGDHTVVRKFVKK